ncbi:MAG: hypothetical protein K0R72_574 [Clostridia bacterium]|jgi:hypothetical protein|nr:hypothetical protein [Clostridia bacterium]
MQSIHINTNDESVFDVKITFNNDGKNINNLMYDMFNQYIIENNIEGRHGTEEVIYFNKINNNSLL